MAIKYNMTMNQADIAKGIAGVGKDIKSAKKRAHCIMVSILFNWNKNGAANVAAQQATECLAQWDGYWAQPIVNWFGNFAGFEYDKEGKTFTYTETKISLEQVTAAKAKTFEQFTKPPVAKPWNLDVEIIKLIETASKRMALNKEGDAINRDHLNALRELAHGFKAA